jgi:renalase
MIDVAIIGAGLSGLVCAKELQQAGYNVLVLEKSRGLGGRVATRRLEDNCADHGLRYLEPQGELSQAFIQSLRTAGILTTWTDQIYTCSKDDQLSPGEATYARFVAPQGMTAIAKHLAAELLIWRSQLVTAIAPQSNGSWEITLEPTTEEYRETVQAKAIVLSIPAPQALKLLQPLEHKGLSPDFLEMIRSVEFDPCLSAIATFPTEFMAQVKDLPWKAVSFSHHPSLAWVGLDSSKRFNSSGPVFVIQSNADFAREWLEATDLTPAGHHLLSHAAEVLVPWLNSPSVLQVHRWRYAFAHTPLKVTHLIADLPQPLICCGDWCGGNNLESALRSGFNTAKEIVIHLHS